MKKKILIFALCCIMLFGVFTISAFAEAEVITDLTGLTFVIPKGAQIPNNYGVFYVEGTVIKAQYNLTFDEIHLGYKTVGAIYNGENKIIVRNDDTTVLNSLDADCYFTFTGGADVTNENLISWLISNQKKHEHTLTSVITPPTHTEKGYTTFTCTDCGDTYKDNYVDPLGHTFTESTVDATCTSKGYTTYTCDCGFTYTEEGAAYGHTFTTTTLDPTCTKKGSITYTCGSCGHSYSESLPKLEHNFVDSRCSVCNALDPSYYLDSEDNILNAWDSVFKDFFSLFGSAQSVFFDGKSLTFLGILVLLSLGLGLSFLLISVIIKFIYSRG